MVGISYLKMIERILFASNNKRIDYFSFSNMTGSHTLYSFFARVVIYVNRLHYVKKIDYRVLSGPYFPTIGLNAVIYRNNKKKNISILFAQNQDVILMFVKDHSVLIFFPVVSMVTMVTSF